MPTISNKKIVLDSCIMLYACDTDTQSSCIEMLNLLLQFDNKLVCSSLSGFEVIKNRQERDDHEKYTSFINHHIDKIPVDSPVLMNAASLYYVYKKAAKITSNPGLKDILIDSKDKLTGDLIIGGTTLSYSNHVLLTANRKDFPEPFWQIIEKFELQNADKTISTYLLQPNIEEISKILGEGLTNTDQQKRRVTNYEYRG